VPEHIPPEPDAERSPFDDYVNNHLDLGGLGDHASNEGDDLPALGAGGTPGNVPPEAGRSGALGFDWDRVDANWRAMRGMSGGTLPSSDDDARPTLGDERPAGTPLRGAGFSTFGGRSAFSGRSPMPFPNLDDPRWRRGTFEVVRDLRVHKMPVLAPGGVGIGSNVMVFTNAFRYDIKKKRLRYIPDVFPGWSAVYLLWDKPVLGYVHQNEVRLTPQTPRLQEHWSEVLLIIGLCLLLLVAIVNMTAPPNSAEARTIEQLNEEIATLQARVNVLESGALDTSTPEAEAVGETSTSSSGG